MNQEIQTLIKENSHLFWWVPEDKKPYLSLDSLVEAILNYGDSESVKKLFDSVGIEKVAEVFFSHIERPRNNYFPQTKHYFTLYFNRYV